MMDVDGAGATVEGVEAETPTWIKRVIRAPWRYFRVRFTFDDVTVRVDAALCKTVRALTRAQGHIAKFACHGSVVSNSITEQCSVM